MKQYFRQISLLFLYFVFISAAFGQTDLGVGLVSVNFDDKTVLRFYERTSDASTAKTIEFFDDKSINSFNIKNLPAHEDWLSPQSLWLDYFSFTFRCKSRRPGWFEVIVNNETGKTYWLRNNKLVSFGTWEQYLKGMFAVERSEKVKQKIFHSPNARSSTINYKGRDCFQVKAMRGEWIEIATAQHCDQSYTNSETKINSGWIKWRRGNELLIYYFGTS